MANASVDFILNPQETVDVDFTVTPDVTYQAVLDLSASTRNHDELSNRDLPDQHPTSAITGLDDTLSSLTESVSTIEGTIETYGDVVTHNADEFATAEQGALADTALQAGDNVSELVNDAGYLRASSLNGYATEGYVNAEIGNITDILDSYGNVVTHNVNEFATAAQGAKADTALQPNDNISELTNDVGYVTSAAIPTNYVTTNTTQTISGDKAFTGIVSIPAGKTYITAANGGARLGYFTYDIDGYSNITLQTMTASDRDINFKTNNSGKVKYKGKEIAIKEDIKDGSLTIQKNGTDVGEFTANQSTDTTINITVPTQASDIGAMPDTTTISDLVTTAQLNALNSGATTTNIGQITTNENDISDINDKIPSQASSSNQLADKNFVNSSIATNTANFIGTFNSLADLEAYSGTVTNNDYAFVVGVDGDGNTVYDRYKYTSATSSWVFEYELNNSSFTASQWASINSGVTTSDVALAQSALQSGDNITELVNNAGYITSASLPTVNDATLTIQKNGTSVGTFTANASSNVTANITVPTDTSDLTNGAGYITGITSGDVTTALGYTPYDSSNPSGYISGITSGDVTTALGYTPADDSGVVKTTGNQSIAGTKTFTGNITSSGSAFKRTSSIDPTTTTGESEVMTLQTVDKNGTTVASYNGTRSGTSNTNRQRVNNSNVSGSNWYDLRTTVSDSAFGYASVECGSAITNRSLSYATNSTTLTYLPTMGWVNNPDKSTNVVHRTGDETIDGNKTVVKELKATLASYSATNGASNASPYKKIGECVLTGNYQTVIVPFMYSRTNPTTSSDSYLGKIILRVEGTAGTLSQNATGVIISEVPDFIDNGDISLYVIYKNNTPESNKVTCQVWVYVKNTYQGVNIMPLRQGVGSTAYSTTNITWGNNLVEASELPSDYTSIIQRKAVIYNVTQSTTDNSRKVATTAYVKNNLADYVTTNTNQTISGAKTFTDNIVNQKSNPQISLKNTDITKGTAPTSTRYSVFGAVYDSQGTNQANKMAQINHSYFDNGTSVLNMSVFKAQSGSTDSSTLGIGYDVNGNVFTLAPTPTQDTTSSTQIDTVGARNTKINSVMNSILPTGTVLPYGGSSAPTGFLMCDGSAVSRTTYADLFDVIGTTYGSGDGSTTFNVPNLSTAVLPSSSTVSVVGNGNALGIVDDLSTEEKQHNALIVGSGSSSFSSAKVPFAKFELSSPLAIGSQASSAQEFGTVRKALGVSTLPEWSGLTGSITGVTLNYIIRT